MTPHAITVFAKWQVKPGELDKVLDLLHTVAQKSREEEGNLFYTVHQQQNDLQVIWLHEGYVNEAAIEAHRQTDHFKHTVLEQVVPLLAAREVVLTRPIIG